MTSKTPAGEQRPHLQGEFAALSTNSTHTVVDGSGHFIQTKDPDAVLEAIRSILRQTDQ